MYLSIFAFLISCSDPDRVKGLAHSDAYYPKNDFYLNCSSANKYGSKNIMRFKVRNTHEHLKNTLSLFPTQERHLNYEFFEYGISSVSFTLIKADNDELIFQGKTNYQPEFNLKNHMKIYLSRNYTNINGVNYLERKVKEFREPIDSTKPISNEIGKPTDVDSKCLLTSKAEFFNVVDEMNREANESELFNKWKQKKLKEKELSKTKDTII